MLSRRLIAQCILKRVFSDIFNPSLSLFLSFTHTLHALSLSLTHFLQVIFPCRRSRRRRRHDDRLFQKVSLFSCLLKCPSKLRGSKTEIFVSGYYSLTYLPTYLPNVNTCLMDIHRYLHTYVVHHRQRQVCHKCTLPTYLPTTLIVYESAAELCRYCKMTSLRRLLRLGFFANQFISLSLFCWGWVTTYNES